MVCLITWSWRLHCLSYSFAICHSRNSNAPQQTSIVCRKIAPRCYNMLRRRGGCPNFMLFVWVGRGGVGAITFRCTCTQQSCYANSQTTFLLYDAIVTTCLLYLQIQMMLRQGGRVGWGVRKRSVCCTCTQK